jgi:hypothetical protein
MSIITLNDGQYQFMARYHETVELGMLLLEFFHINTVIRELEKDVEYCNLMDDMVWMRFMTVTNAIPIMTNHFVENCGNNF